MHRVLIPILFFIFPQFSYGEKTTFPGIQELMTNEEFKQAGLYKQSQTEIEALNQWLVRYTANEAQFVKRDSKEVKKAAEKSIHSNIDGEFIGWNGKTIFHLQNGQVWQQRTSGIWRTRLQNPEVVISKNFLGFYQMKMVKTKKKIGVKRIK